MIMETNLLSLTDLWAHLKINPTLKQEITDLLEKKEFEQLNDRLSQNILFGTAGLRGKMEAGFNRINDYTIQRISLAVAGVLKNDKKKSEKTVVISYDTRKNSKHFANLTKNVFLSEGFKVIFFPSPTPTPLLSFAVKFFKTDIGIMITASHNPKEYNGYKVFSDHGGQILPQKAKMITDYMESIRDISLNPFTDTSITPDFSFYEEYYQKILGILKPSSNRSSLKILYTPLYGTGKEFVTELLKNRLHLQMDLLESQSDFNGEFPSLSMPNPELIGVYSQALEYAQNKDYDLILASDPDADRIGVLVKHQNQFEFINGNELGIIITHYLLSQKSYTSSSYIASSIVSTDMVNKIATSFKVESKKTLTGFRYISDLIQKDPQSFLFGFEESHGYLIGSYIQDKDAMSALGLISLIASYKKDQNKTLVDYLNDLYLEYGFYKNKAISLRYDSNEYHKIERIMDYFYKSEEYLFKEEIFLDSFKVKEKYDFKSQKYTNFLNDRYEKSFTQFEKSNLLIFYLEPDLKIAVRPSGTESCIKIYLEIQVCPEEYQKKNKKDLMFELSEYENIIKRNLKKI